MTERAAGALVAVLLLAACGGGGGVTLPKTDPVTSSPTTTTTTLAAAVGGDPLISGGPVGSTSGVAPLAVGYDLCASRDARGGQDLTFTADFGDGAGPATQPGCGFRHTFGSDGVSVYNGQQCVVDNQTKKSACKPSAIKAYLGSSVDWKPRTCGPPTIDATATLAARAFQGVTALSAVDKVVFEAYDPANLNNRLAVATVTGQGPVVWQTQTWVVNQSKVRVFATIYSRNVAGDDRPSVSVDTGCP